MTVKNLGSFIQIYYTHKHTHACTHTHTDAAHTITIIFIKLIPYVNVFFLLFSRGKCIPPRN